MQIHINIDIYTCVYTCFCVYAQTYTKHSTHMHTKCFGRKNNFQKHKHSRRSLNNNPKSEINYYGKQSI